MLNDLNISNLSQSFDTLLRNLAGTGRGKKQLLSMLIDFSLAAFSLWLAFSLRFNGVFTDFLSTWYLFVAVPIVTVLACIGFGVYRWMIRSSNISLYTQLAKTAFVASLVCVLVVFLFPPDRIMPRSLFVIFGLLLMLTTSGVRIVWQGLFSSIVRGEPIVIYGAGEAGQKLASSVVMGDEFHPVAFIDDDPALTDTVVGGIPILDGNRADLIQHVRQLDVNKVVLAMPSMSAERLQSAVDLFESADFVVQTVPTTAEMLATNSGAVEVRDVSIADILGRSEVAPDEKLLGYCVRGKSVLVTGGGGSIGSELCRQILALDPKLLMVLDNSELNLYQVTEELNSTIAAIDMDPAVFKPVLCSVLDAEQIEALITSNNIETIYHAAAYKHVPIVEAHPEQGASVNIFGTATVLDAAIAASVEHFVLISTDKAVRPTNSMGASKRAAEMYLQAKAHDNPHTRISMVRFGNVLGSSGSVVPKFTKQILEGGPITLTHAEVTRFFMTIPEAAQLVLQASALSSGGDVFVLDMGDSVRIEDLATRMVRLHGKHLTRDTGDASDIEIVYQGLRPGEKLYEELFLGEDNRRTEVVKVFTTNEIFLPADELDTQLQTLKKHIAAKDRPALRAALLNLSTMGYANGDETEKRAPTSATVHQLPVAETSV